MIRYNNIDLVPHSHFAIVVSLIMSSDTLYFIIIQLNSCCSTKGLIIPYFSVTYVPSKIAEILTIIATKCSIFLSTQVLLTRKDPERISINFNIN